MIEILKEMLEEYIGCRNGIKQYGKEYYALSEAIVALQQKEDDRKKGALEELKKTYKDIDVLWSRVSLDLMTASKIKDILYNRIKELEEEGVEK